MKTKIFLSMLVLFACAATLSAITREQADEIVINYAKSEMKPGVGLYSNNNTPSTEGFTVTTSKGEIVKAKYACWVYWIGPAAILEAPIQQHYLFVKEDNGSLLEIITTDVVVPNLNLWTKVNVPKDIVEPKENNKFLYPNPVDDWLTIPCNGENTRVEIYDLKGTRLFSGTLSEKETCQLNVSFLNSGVYMVNVDGKTYKIIKS